ncbi:flagellar biosynthetic protein FliR [soil metagenome]
MNALLPHLAPFLLVLLRISGLFVFAPVLSSGMIPGKVKILLAALFALIIYIALPQATVLGASTTFAVDRLEVFTFASAALLEVLLGAVVGLVALMPLLAVQLASAVLGQQMGFGLASVYNPALDTEGDPLGELFLQLAVGSFIFMGGLDALFGIIARSFISIAPGAASTAAMPAHLVVGAVSSGLELALRVAAPVLGILLIETIATSFIMKTMPSLNIMSIGYGLKIILGFCAIILSLKAIEFVIAGHIETTMRALMLWA